MSLAALVMAAVSGEPAATLDRVSLMSAYLFVLMIGFVLLVGPVRAVRTGRATVNHTLRRDVAIWCGIIGLVHLVAGTAESMTPGYMDVFVSHAASAPSATVRETFFLWSTIAGFIVGILVVILLALSNNRSLAWLGQIRWKRLHRLSYLVFGLTMAHGVGFQVLESRRWAGYAALVAMAGIVCVAQILGIRAVRRRSGH